MRRLSGPLLGLALAAAPSIALADRPYVTIVDDGTIQNHNFATPTDEAAIEAKLLALYAATGQELPEILSVWTTFPLGGGSIGTFYDPLANDVSGIGLQAFFPPDGVFASTHPPLKSILFHNDVLELTKRAALQNAPEDGFATYLFLLELSHNWGPALDVPAPNTGELIGFPFHWSYWMDAGGSPAGGNTWKDNGDGTFTAIAADPKTIKYSMLDLYIMGLATKAEVPPFGVLENAVPPAGIVDPFSKGPYAAHSFPWFDGTKVFTASATRRKLTIDDVVTANGARSPAAGASQTSWKLGIVLLTSGSSTPADLAAAQGVFDPIAAGFAPAFHAATHDRGTLDVVTHSPAPMGGGGGAGGASATAATSSTASGKANPTTSGGCSTIAGEVPPSAGFGALALGAIVTLRRRARNLTRRV